jgi:hypothetical protein
VQKGRRCGGNAARVAASALLASLVTASASAQTGDAIEYSADAACPQRESFMADVRARTDRLSSPPHGQAVVVYRVRAETTPRGAHGRLDVVDASGATSSRDVEGVTCNDVVDALALVLALAVDPNASTAPLASIAPPAAARVEDGGTPSAPRRPAPPWSGHLGASFGAEVNAGVTPALLVGPVLGVEASIERVTQGPRIEPILELRAAITRAQSGTVSAEVGAARFVWTAGQLDACPLRAIAGPVQAVPCARLEGGILEAAGMGVDVSHDVSSTWLAVGGMVRVRWTPLSVLFVDVDGALLAPLQRDHFYFSRPQTGIYDVPAIRGGAALSAGVRFW